MSMNNYFFILPEFIKDYHATIEQGKLHLKQKKIIITGLTRNNEKKLEKNIRDLQKLSDDVKFFIYENDSSDKTKNLLKAIKKDNANFDYLSEDLQLKSFGQVKDLERTNNLSLHRNKCVNHIKKYHKDTDYTVVIDLDFDSISLNGIFHSFGKLRENKNIHAIAGFSYEIKDTKNNDKILWNYDSWAFRLNWWEDLQKYYLHYKTDPMYWFGLFKPPIGSDLMPVNSAFGGCGIYKTNIFIKGNYSGEDCEHVTFHKSLKNKIKNFQLFVNPSQIMMLN